MKVKANWVGALVFTAGSMLFAGCALDQNNVADVYGSSQDSQRTPAVQIPESMKTGSVTGETRGPSMP